VALDVLPLFTAWVLKSEERYTFCWYWLAGVLGPLFFVNIFNIVLIAVDLICTKIRRSKYMIKKKHAKEKKEAARDELLAIIRQRKAEKDFYDNLMAIKKKEDLDLQRAED